MAKLILFLQFPPLSQSFAVYWPIEELQMAAQHGGIGFSQNMIIHNGITQKSFRNLKSKFEYRALCELNGKICIIDSQEAISYAKFISLLEKIGITHALYLDMGGGWNHSWYRNNDGKTVDIHPKTHSYTTNWLVFKR